MLFTAYIRLGSSTFFKKTARWFHGKRRHCYTCFNMHQHIKTDAGEASLNQSCKPQDTLSPAASNLSLADSVKVYKLLNATLIEILAQPEATTPYTRLLAGMIDIMSADAGALYNFPVGAAPNTPTAIEGDLSRYTSIIQNFAASLDQSQAPTSWYSDKQTPELLIYSVRVCTDNDEAFALLLLINEKTSHLITSRHALFEIFGKGFANMLCATQRGQMNRRRDLQNERASISRELHDSLAQSLTYLKIQASRIQSILMQDSTADNYEESEIKPVVQELRDNLNIAYRRLRELMTTFRLTMNGEGFDQAIEDSVREFEKRASVVFQLDNRLSNEDLTAHQEMQVIHIVREALSNIVRHSHAKRARVSLRHTDGNKVQICVADDGVGIDETQQRAQHLGLIIMQERCRNLGGEFSVCNQHGEGAKICLTFTPNKSTDNKQS